LYLARLRTRRQHVGLSKMKRKFSRYLPEQHSAWAGHCPRRSDAVSTTRQANRLESTKVLAVTRLPEIPGDDLEMLQWTTISDGVRFGVIVHRTDAEREYAYDKKSHFGRLDAALDACRGQ
jgi:hypothetical protein